MWSPPISARAVAEAPVLEIAGLNVSRGATHVLKDVSLSVRAGEIVALIGANGAGKTTTLMTVSGLLRPQSGTILYEGPEGEADLARLAPSRIVRSGIVQCPEGRQIFASLTVEENLLVGAYTRSDAQAVAEDMERVRALFPVLAERASQRAGSLSGGEQMMLAVARALLARPRLLLMDEPSLGLAPQIIERIFDTVLELNRDGVTVLLVEQNAAMALEIAHRGYVLENGRVALSGTGAELAGDENVRRAYLGAGQ